MGTGSIGDTREELETFLDAFEARVARAREDADSRPEERAGRLRAIEVALWEVLARASAVDASMQVERGHPLLLAAGRWRDRLRDLGLATQADRVEEVIGRLAGEEAEAWARAAASPGAPRDAERVFSLLLEATRFDLEVLERRRGASGGGVALGGVRTDLRDELRQAIEIESIGTRVRGSWVHALTDLADLVLASADGENPDRALAQLDLVRDALGWHLENVERKPTLERRRLRARFRRLSAIRMDRVLERRLLRRFGERFVGWWERAVVVAIVAVLAVLYLEMFVVEHGPDGQPTDPALHNVLFWVDAAISAFFLWDFSIRFLLVRGSRRWFVRNFFTGFLPALPLSLLGVGSGENSVLRILRSSRLLRVVTPLIRALGFLARGIDRIVRQYGELLNRNIILHPTPGERHHDVQRERSLASRIYGIQADVNRQWLTLMSEEEGEQRVPLADCRHAGLHDAIDFGWSPRIPDAVSSRANLEVETAEHLLDRLARTSGEEIEGALGAGFVARIARAVRIFTKPILHWMPFIHGYVPRVVPTASDAEITASALQRVVERVRGNLGRLHWFADLHGTVTPSELVDRVGTELVKRTARPANRLLLLGGAILLLQGLLAVVNISGLSSLSSRVTEIVGIPVVVVGSVCLIFLGLGFWLQRIASEATAFYEQVAQAQFLNLTEACKARQLERDVSVLERRVLRMERTIDTEDVNLEDRARRDRDLLCTSIQGWLVAGRYPVCGFDAIGRATLIYRDVLDGALLAESDTRTTGQLLGNLALRRARTSSGRMGKREIKSLERLDLKRARSALRGPYLWFVFISKAIAQGAARMIVNYNRFAIPLNEIERASQATRARYDNWLREREENPGGRVRNLESDDEVQEHLTTSFTALHFLDADPSRDAEVAERFGPRVLALLERDRRALFRRVFGCYPLHKLPKDQRVLNLREFYNRNFEGGRALLLPWTFLKRVGHWTVVGIRFVARAVEEIRNPRLSDHGDQDALADFTVAVRKIERMRGPGAQACLWQRSLVDVEYMGISIPGLPIAPETTGRLEHDLAFLDASDTWRRDLKLERERAASDMRRLARLIEEGLEDRVRGRIGGDGSWTPEHRRALAVAYRSDDQGLRAYLSCLDVLREEAAHAQQEAAQAPRWIPKPALKRAFKAWWAEHGEGDSHARVAAWRAFRRNRGGSAKALEIWHELGAERARARGEELCAEALRHPGKISEQLVTLRVVQTLSLIEIMNYRRHVWDVGGYALGGEDPGDLLEMPCEPKVDAEAAGVPA